MSLLLLKTMAGDGKLLLVILCLFFVLSDASCPQGKFGFKCQFKCGCKNDVTCNPLDGSCPDGCNPKFYGPHCLLLNPFIYDPLGKLYTGTMNSTESGQQCKPWTTSIFKQFFNYTGGQFADKSIPGAVCRNPNIPAKNKTSPWCFTNINTLKEEKCYLSEGECPNGRFSPNCVDECHCQNLDPCDKQTGKCKECYDGWIGPACQKKCDTGKYGPGCKETCGECKDDLCDHETGQCLNGCNAGWKGDLCNTNCSSKEYGENCALSCGECYDDLDCDIFTGQCPEGCKDGYNGTMCVHKCMASWFGKGCSKQCGKCKDQSPCHHKDGSCVEGCEPGWMQADCSQICMDGWFGQNCSLECGNCMGDVSCDKISGQCLGECQNGFTGELCKSAIFVEEETSSAGTIGAIVGVVIILVIVIIIIIAFKLWRRGKFRHTLQLNETKSSNDTIAQEKEEVLRTKETDQLIQDKEDPSESLDNGYDISKEPIYANVNTKKQTCPIQVQDLYEYIRKNKMNDCTEFKKEFGELPLGVLALYEAARKPENRPKNRYGNIIAYDHSRVVLTPISSEPNSDYINANYLDGYKRKNAYIASQGPMKVMFRDFWRMIWQKQCCKIVMLTNLMEACKTKCEQYWPDEGSTSYGNVSVEIVQTTVYTDFTIRTFKISCNGTSRDIKQFHFTSWSDHGTLTSSTPLLCFKHKVDAYNKDSTAPVVVHCSAGIGRTGTYIGLDYTHEQAKAEGFVDVLKCAQLMRANRTNMIQTWEQYMFLYDALLEAVLAGETTMPVGEFESRYQEMCIPKAGFEVSALDKQFEVAQKLLPNIENTEFKAALAPENIDKNRVKNVLPANRYRPHLYTQVEGSNDYINAVFLPGYTSRDRFIVTQMPLPKTVADFWRMLYDYNSNTVIMLNEFDRNDKTCALYWPEEYGYTVSYDPLSIELLSSSESNKTITERIFKLSNKIKNEDRAVKQFEFNWGEKNIPSSAQALADLLREVDHWTKQSGKGPITVHCMNGASRSGLYCAISLLLERKEQDQEIDVFQTVKTIRNNRPQFIEDKEQYQFCYKMAECNLRPPPQ
ncbi:receptor-type tyrosine-protein phosphatase epsilon-like [Mytilus edulis]|uniref:receptor-type tyrosine-protein phosphatase epsilon-like n=1 Tax=Mytilus edulis TaxID=6550 RepID=UPI0039F10A6A